MNAAGILEALGGRENVVELESCITRLRAQVKDPERVDEAAMKEAGAFGTAIHGHSVQVVVGPDADDVRAAISAL